MFHMCKNGYVQALLIFAGAAALSFGGYNLYKQQLYRKEPVPTAIEINSAEHPLNSDELKPGSLPMLQPATDSEPVVFPTELNLKMTFYPQAPFGNWDYPWQEACEEASSLLIANTYFGRNWTREEFNEQLLELVEWEKETFGHYEHTDVAETVKMLDHLGLKSVVHPDPSFEDIQKAINRRNFIIMPVAGKILANPFYSNGGPTYHMLVVKGYKENSIITNDVGTRHGEDFVYGWNKFQQSIHDYAEPIEDGTKLMIEVLQPEPK
jgi:hypothetical protein